MRRLFGDILVPRATTVALWAWVAFNLALVAWVGIQSLKDPGQVWLSPFALPDSLEGATTPPRGRRPVSPPPRSTALS
jgi:hypothetical protein